MAFLLADQEETFGVIFQLDSEWVDSDLNPTPNWHSEFTPVRDSAGREMTILPIRIPDAVRQESELGRIFKISANSAAERQAIIERLEQTRGVVWAETAPIRYTAALPSPRRDSPPGDPYYSLQWSLERIHAPAGWDISRGDTSVTIAVIDVGVDTDHSDLVQQLWTNWPEANGTSGVDDDGNGFIDDVHGWDFQDDDPNPKPGGNDAHGTHVAGIACAAVDNGYGVAGVGWNCRLMSIRVGYGNYITFGYEGVIYAVASGADIVNLSWGSGSPSNVERITAEYAASQGVLIVAAAGNENIGPHYPAAYPDVIGVAATTQGDRMASYSNYGSWVNISAPGDQIISTYPNNRFGLESGTSMSTPIVAGAAGLLMALHPGWSPAQVRQQLILTADSIDDVNPQRVGLLGGGRLNLYRALSESKAGFSLVEIDVDDSSLGNADGIIDPGERLYITCTIENLLTETVSVRGVLRSGNARLAVDMSTAEFGTIEPGSVGSNGVRPFQVTIGRATAANMELQAELELYVDNRRIQSLPIILTVRSSYATHNNSNIACTVTNFGAIGYYDYTVGDGRGEGFRFPTAGMSALFHGSLFVGAPPDRVADCAYGNVEMDRFDFVAESGAMILKTSDDGVQVGITEFSDDEADNLLDILVRQESYTYLSEADEDYIILSYSITNKSITDYQDVYVGLYLDWDIVQAENNVVKWNEANECGWMAYARGGYSLFGAALLDNPASFHVALENSVTSRGWDDRSKYQLMQNGFNNPTADIPDDYSQFIGTGPFDLNAADSIKVSFVLAAGSDEADLLMNIQTARTKWGDEFSLVGNFDSLDKIELISINPSPFNTSTVVSFYNPFAASATWSLVDLNGRLVLPSQHVYLNQGVSDLQVSAGSLPSGQYLFKLECETSNLIVPLTLTR